MRLERQEGHTMKGRVGHVRDFRFHSECTEGKSTLLITAH